MKDSKEPGIIVNTGSKQGITMPPGNLTYNMSKAALKCYTEGLEHELRSSDDSNHLRSALLIPGWVNTSIALKQVRQEKKEKGEDFDPSTVFFHEDKPAAGAWMPQQVCDFLIQGKPIYYNFIFLIKRFYITSKHSSSSELDKGKFYIVCPDNEVDRETDNLRMTWTMQDITLNRPPLSRWHPDWKEKFNEFLSSNKTQ
jgi:hypothetical protein